MYVPGMCMCAYIPVHIVHAWRLENRFQCESSPSVLLETGCLVHYCVCLASRPMSFWVFSVSFACFDGGSLGLQTHYWARMWLLGT